MLGLALVAAGILHDGVSRGSFQTRQPSPQSLLQARDARAVSGRHRTLAKSAPHVRDERNAPEGCR